MADTLSIRRDPSFDADLAALASAYPNPTSAIKAALRELADKHRYWQSIDEVIAELEADGFTGTDETDAWARSILR